MTVRPDVGIVIPVSLVHVRDGDTVVVKARYEWAVRLIDCWCPEKHTEAGRVAKKFVESFLTSYDHDLLLQVPLEHVGDNILKLFTFDRVPGFLWVGDRTLNQIVVDAGHGTKTK